MCFLSSLDRYYRFPFMQFVTAQRRLCSWVVECPLNLTRNIIGVTDIHRILILFIWKRQSVKNLLTNMLQLYPFVLITLCMLIFGIIKALLGICFKSIKEFGLRPIIIRRGHLTHYYQKKHKNDTVVYDEDGYPVNPQTGEKARCIPDWAIHFLNVLFIPALPIILTMLLMQLWKKQKYVPLSIHYEAENKWGNERKELEQSQQLKIQQLEEQSGMIGDLKSKLSLSQQELKNLEDNIKTLQDQLTNVNEQKKKLEENCNRKQLQINKQSISIKSLSDKLIQRNEIIRELQAEMHSNNEKLNIKEDQLKKLKDNLEEKELENVKLTTNLDEMKEKLEDAQKENKTSENIIQRIKRQLNEKQTLTQKSRRNTDIVTSSKTSRQGHDTTERTTTDLLAKNTTSKNRCKARNRPISSYYFESDKDNLLMPSTSSSTKDKGGLQNHKEKEK